MSIRAALIFGVTILVVLAVGAVTVVAVWNVYADSEARAAERADRDVESVRAQLAQRLDAHARRFFDAVDTVDVRDVEKASPRLMDVRADLGLDLLNVCTNSGVPLVGSYVRRDVKVPISDDPVLRRALAGEPAMGLARLPAGRVELEGGTALETAVSVTAEAGDIWQQSPPQGLFLWYALPKTGADGRVIALVYGGHSLNFDYEFVDRLREGIAGSEEYRGRSRAAVELYAGGTAVATNVRTDNGTRAVGLRLDDQTERLVLQEGQSSTGREWIMDGWYRTRVRPLENPDGRPIGMLRVATLEAPFLDERWGQIVRLLVPAGAACLVAILVAMVLGMRIARPLRRLAGAAEQVAAGNWQAELPSGRTYREPSRLTDAVRRIQGAVLERDNRLRSQQRGVEQAREAHEAAEQQYRTVLRFIGDDVAPAAADLRWTAETLAGSDGEPLPPDVRKTVAQLCGAAGGMERMVANYRDLASCESGRADMGKALVDVREQIVEPAARRTSPLLDAKGIELEIACPEGLTAEGDPDMLRRATENLLSNAASFGRRRGKAKLEVTVQGGQVVVSVWNEGEGFDPEDTQRLFAKFSRLDNAAEVPGSGLGLFLVRWTAELHGGTVSAESNHGRWAKFTFSFPASS